MGVPKYFPGLFFIFYYTPQSQSPHNLLSGNFMMEILTDTSNVNTE